MRTARKYFAGLLLVLFLTSMAAAAPEFLASKKSDKYHYPSCRYAKRIKAENRITFETPAEARTAGYVPCKVCKPPAN